MILHIVRKDLRLLWRFVLLVVGLQIFSTAAFFHIDHSQSHANPYGSILQLTLLITFLARAILIVLCVQQDAVPGVSQDWLSRPIRRRDLVLAKLVFVFVFAQLPVFLCDVFQCLGSGSSLAHSLAAAFARSVYYLPMFTLPLVAFGSLTKNLTQALAAGVVGFLLFVYVQVLTVGMSEGRHSLSINPTNLTGMEWMQDFLCAVILLAAAAIILALQYRSRKTRIAGMVLIAAGILCTFAPYLPWSAAYAMQQELSPKSDAAKDISLHFDPMHAPYNNASGVAEGTDTTMYLPLRVDGLPQDSLLKNDHATVTLITLDNKRVDLGVSGDFQTAPQGNNKDIYYPIVVRAELFNRYKDQPVRIEIDYSLTALHTGETTHIAALRGNATMKTLGQCSTQINSAETAIDVRCLQAGSIPHCTSTVLEDPTKGLQNPQRIDCFPSYAPFAPRTFPDGMGRFYDSIPFRDPAHPGDFSLQGKDLPESRVALTVYEPTVHFQRHISTPALRMSDWLPR